MKLHNGKEWWIYQIGVKLKGSKFNTIQLEPEEVLAYWEEVGPDAVKNYLEMLTKHYKRND